MIRRVLLVAASLGVIGAATTAPAVLSTVTGTHKVTTPLATISSAKVSKPPGQHPAVSAKRIRCLDLPISGQLVTPDSCWQTGPISMLIAGTSPTEEGAGVVVVVRGQGQQVTAIRDSGPLTVKEATTKLACVRASTGRYYSVGLSNGAVSRKPARSCLKEASVGATGGPRSRAQATGSKVTLATTTAAEVIPPPVTASYYEYLAYASHCGSGATTGCMLYLQGQSTITPGAGGLLVLDFGAQCSSGTSYGVQMFGSTGCTPDSTVHQLVQAWINGYESDHVAGTPDFTVAVGTSNSYTAADPPTYEPASLQTAGADWYQGVVGSGYITGAAPVTLWGASDMEESGGGQWYDGADTIAWVTGYSAAAFPSTPSSECSLSQTGFLADFGDDNSGGLAGAGWTTNQVYDVAQGIIGTCALPEIYYSGNAPEWVALSQWAQTNGYQPMQFTAVMVEPGGSSQCPPPNGSTLMSASCAWTQLESETGQVPSIPGITQIATALQAPGPQVTAISPAYGPEQTLTPVTISGSGFLGAQTVYFGSQTVSVTPSEVNPTGTAITIDSPSQAASRVDVVVVTALGSSSIGSADEFQYDAPACTAISVSLAAPSAAPGFSDQVTASATCPAGAATEYSYFIRAGDSATWTLVAAGIGSTWTWNTGGLSSGDYQVLAWASDGPYGVPQVQALTDLTIVVPSPCTGVSVSATPSSVLTGNAVAVTATPACPTGSIPEYSYFVRPTTAPVWTLESAWIGPSWNWSTSGLPPGDYQVLVWVSDGPTYGVPQAQTAVPVTVQALAACSSDAVAVTPQVLQGQVATISASSACPAGSAPLYSYFLLPEGASAWTLEAAWVGPTWSLDTSHLTPGAYQVLAWVSDGPYGAPQAQAVAPLTVEPLTACTSASVNLPSTVTEGLPVSVTASATCPSGAQVKYSYFVRADGAPTWTLEAAWIGPDWTWSTVGLPDGAYQVLAWASDGLVYGTPQVAAVSDVAVYTQQPCTALTVATSPSALVAGQPVTVSAAGTCPAGTVPRYAYFTSASSGGPWTLQAAWIGSSWTWSTAGLANGSYYVLVWVSGAEYQLPEAQAVSSITVNTPATCTGVTATVTPSTVTSGQSVAVSASATCPNGATPLYSYFTGPSASGPWTLDEAWGSGTWTWPTSGLLAGDYYVLVWASAGPYTIPQVQAMSSMRVN